MSAAIIPFTDRKTLAQGSNTPRKAEAEPEATSAQLQRQSLGPPSRLAEDGTLCHSGDTMRDLSWPTGSRTNAPISSVTAEILLLDHTEVPKHTMHFSTFQKSFPLFPLPGLSFSVPPSFQNSICPSSTSSNNTKSHKGFLGPHSYP